MAQTCDVRFGFLYELFILERLRIKELLEIN